MFITHHTDREKRLRQLNKKKNKSLISVYKKKTRGLGRQHPTKWQQSFSLFEEIRGGSCNLCAGFERVLMVLGWRICLQQEKHKKNNDNKGFFAQHDASHCVLLMPN